MTNITLSYSDLGITLPEIFVQMGYGEAEPDEATLAETLAMIERIGEVVKPQFCFFIVRGNLDTEHATLTVGARTLEVGAVIARQLRGSSHFCVFAATAGEGFEKLRHEVESDGDMVKVYILDAIGSVVAEKTADRMELELERLVASYALGHTNRFSPGYCGWNVAGQHTLFSLFPEPTPCGITLSPSALMTPIKSVSGIIGLGPSLKKLPYSCLLCTQPHCYKRRRQAAKAK